MTRPLLRQDRPQINALGTRLPEARERRKISDELMAQRMDVPPETLHRLESGDASIALADVYRPLRILGLAKDIDNLAQDDELSGKLLSNKERR